MQQLRDAFAVLARTSEDEILTGRPGHRRKNNTVFKCILKKYGGKV
jgi:hypothetical protein